MAFDIYIGSILSQINDKCDKQFKFDRIGPFFSRKRDAAQYLNRCKELLRDDGFIMVIEPTSHYEIALAIQGLTGEELDTSDETKYCGKLRKWGMYFTNEQLLELFETCGFRLCNKQVRFLRISFLIECA